MFRVGKLAWAILFIALMAGSLMAARAASWTPVAAPSLPPFHWRPTNATDPRSQQTLNATEFAAGGGTFVAELLGMRRVTETSAVPFLLRVVRTGGDDARLEVTSARLDGTLPDRYGPEGGEIDARFATMVPLVGTNAFAADASLRVWRPVGWGFRETEPVTIYLTADIEHPPFAAAADGSPGPRLRSLPS